LIADIRRVVSKLAEPIEVSGKLVSIRADIGIVLEAETGRGTDELLADADMALYHAKAKGPDGYALFASFMRADANARQALAEEIEGVFKLGRAACSRADCAEQSQGHFVSPTSNPPIYRRCTSG